MAAKRETVFRYLSLGAGVQSSALALMFARHDERLADFDMPEFAVFADTGCEPKPIYDHLEWIKDELPFPIIKVSAGNLYDNTVARLSSSGNQKYRDMPVFMADGRFGRRTCTSNYKIKVIDRYLRERRGLSPDKYFPRTEKVIAYIGVSIDEGHRMNDNRLQWIINTYPLVDIGFKRQNCKQWFDINYPGRQLMKSACVICPYRSNKCWMDLKEKDPEGFGMAVELDRRLRIPGDSLYDPKEGPTYLHKDLIPLDEAIGKRKEAIDDQLDLFGNECSGMCGL